MSAQKNHHDKKVRMDELLQRAQTRLGKDWQKSWLLFFYELIERRQVLTHEVIDELESTLNNYVQMQAVSPNCLDPRRI